jgi:hypothetical protein
MPQSGHVNITLRSAIRTHLSSEPINEPFEALVIVRQCLSLCEETRDRFLPVLEQAEVVQVSSTAPATSAMRPVHFSVGRYRLGEGLEDLEQVPDDLRDPRSDRGGSSTRPANLPRICRPFSFKPSRAERNHEENAYPIDQIWGGR